MDIPIAVAGLIVGFVVGMTGMGGGALMTPVLILFFGISAPAAVSSDLVASVIMRPVGAAVHLRRGTVQGGLVLWLSIGSVPMAFVGVLLIKVLAHGQQIQGIVQLALGAALLVSAAALVLKALINLRQRARGEHLREAEPAQVPVRKVRTLLIGALGGLVVGMTSVGSGSPIIACLLFLYPRLEVSQLVGTDLVQAMPLVASAALGHLIFGDVQFASPPLWWWAASRVSSWARWSPPWPRRAWSVEPSPSCSPRRGSSWSGWAACSSGSSWSRC